LATTIGSLFAQLRRRNVFKVAVAYVVVAWLLIQAATTVLPNLGLPPWTSTLVIVLVALGFPIALVFAWAHSLPLQDEPTISAEPAERATTESLPSATSAEASASIAVDVTTGERDDAERENRPSVAVLPFLNMIGDPAQEYFADGMTEDLITDLSKLSGLCVIARNSSFTFKGQAVDVREAAQTLGARYVIEGSVRKAGERVRINAQLIDAESGTHVWAERYDGELAEVFDLQDEILDKIVSALQVSLNIGEKTRLESRMTADLAAYDLFLKGRNERVRGTSESMAAALELLEQAVALDPGFAAAHAHLSEMRMARAMSTYDPEEFDACLRDSLQAAETAVACDGSLGLAHAFLGWSQIWLRYYDEAMASFERAEALAPNDIEVLAHYAQSLNYVGEPERALTMFDLAARLDPLLPPILRFGRGVSLFLLNRTGEALDVFRAVAHLMPGFLPPQHFLAAVLSELGRDEEAKAIAAELRNLRGPFAARQLLRRVPIRDRVVRERISAAFQAAGLLD
jgi:adenylate cyclase